MLSLFRNYQFSSLIGAQFLAALNDNFLKQIFLLMVVRSAMGGTGGVDYQLQGAGTAVFALPFLLFSALAGNLSDRWGKGRIVRGTKLVEVVVALIATWGLIASNFYIILGALLLLSTQSCFFSPAKYGILPELLDRSQLSRGNGILQMTTYVAILLGTAGAGVTLSLFSQAEKYSGYFMVLVAVVGWVLSLGVEGEEAQDPERKILEFPLEQLARGFSLILDDTILAVGVMNFVFVWFVGTILTLNMNVYGMVNLGLNAMWTSLLNVFLAVGLGLGSYVAGYFSGDDIRLGFVPIGGLAMGFGLIVLLLTGNSFYLSTGLIFIAGFSGGFFLIPVQTLTQDRPPDEHRGEILGLLNFFTFAGVLFASALYTLIVGVMNLVAPIIMLVIGLLALSLSLFLLLVFPEYRPAGNV